MLKTLAFFVFVVTFIHVSILVGAIAKTPVIGPAFKAGAAQDDRLYVSIPLKVYGSFGEILWKSETVAELIKKVYSQIFKEGFQRLKPSEFKGLADIYLWNKVVMASLGVFLVLLLFRRRRT